MHEGSEASLTLTPSLAASVYLFSEDASLQRWLDDASSDDALSSRHADAGAEATLSFKATETGAYHLVVLNEDAAENNAVSVNISLS